MIYHHTRYVYGKPIKMLVLYYHKSMGKIKENEDKKSLMIHYYVLDKVYDQAKEITGTEKFGDTESSVDIDDKLTDNITFKNAGNLNTWIIKDDGKFYLRRSIDRSIRWEQLSIA